MSASVQEYFSWSNPTLTLEDVTLELYEATVGSELERKFPVDSQYCSRYCRLMLRLLENSDAEQLQELLYEKVGKLYSSSQSDDDVAAYRTYFLSASQPDLTVSVRESRAVISGGTTGLSTWTAGQSLAGWLDSRPHLLSGNTILELGAGAGLTGIFALKRWRTEIREYTFTDCHTKVLDNLKHNLRTNLADWRCSQDSEVFQLENAEDKTLARVRGLDWETFSETEALCADLILGADIVFDPSLLPSLVNTLRALLANRKKSRALLACCVRNMQTFHLFLSLLTENNLSFAQEELRTVAHSPVYLLNISMT